MNWSFDRNVIDARRQNLFNQGVKHEKSKHKPFIIASALSNSYDFASLYGDHDEPGCEKTPGGRGRF